MVDDDRRPKKDAPEPSTPAKDAPPVPEDPVLTDEELDEALDESFPASDPLPPPTHTGRHD
ncbi:hypothetical protein [Acuticoccus kandeliae]|uniref:hypothetical protein n=1 Tax=Acuticoccus kandeliae TaxID=2073160 RepID=UPI000D3E42F4|nr:hypothetical protein [Acuticoccus kandeliae]